MEWREEQQLIDKINGIETRLIELENLVRGVLSPLHLEEPQNIGICVDDKIDMGDKVG